ncbi:MAG: phosphate regulon transcriptional regulator PhoB [Oceanococcus sp.]
MTGTDILVVEDEKPIRDLLRFSLEREGFHIRAAADVAQARLAMAEKVPDLLLLDWMMPQTSGMDFARELKQSETFADVPVIMLTARGEEGDKIKGLNTGCDDYVTKPFSTAELVARISAVLRRTLPGGSDELINFGGLQINVAAQRVLNDDGQAINLGPTEYRLLHFFVSHPDRVYSREQLLDRVWGQNVYIEERTVDVHIRRLRKALSAVTKDWLIQTVRGSGYRCSEHPS